jgi:hypothetical protein
MQAQFYKLYGLLSGCPIGRMVACVCIEDSRWRRLFYSRGDVMLGDRKREFTDSGGLGMKVELDPAQIGGWSSYCIGVPIKWLGREEAESLYPSKDDSIGAGSCGNLPHGPGSSFKANPTDI